MAHSIPTFTLGIEEEFFLIDSESRDLIPQVPPALFKAFNKQYPERLVKEFLSTQVEINTTPCHSIAKIRNELQTLRSTLIAMSKHYGLVPLASSTHPFACWKVQNPINAPRYQRIEKRLQISARRMSVCGMHIHIGIPSKKERLRLHNLIRWYLPYLLLLSTSSPFWAGLETGLNSYRISVIDSLPRSGLPEQFTSLTSYNKYVKTLINADAMTDASEIWWDSRMSCRYPTLEIRIMDVCPRLEDAIAITALAMCLARWLYRQKRLPEIQENILQAITHENRWRAQRNSLRAKESLLDRDAELYPAKTIFSNLIEQLQEDAEALNCQDELTHILKICEQGTSADRQRALFKKVLSKNPDPQKAHLAVIDDLLSEMQNV